ncbi:MAG: phage portal protein [Oscillospiraceae bacterium]|jgi:HK97 family phage portal protein|nr:phage portal protein [Oscillospiraceae bacterium]
MPLFAKKTQPKNALSTTRPFFFGRANSSAVVNERTALSQAAVLACVRVISESVASLPLHLYKFQGTGGVAATAHPLYRLLHTAPNPDMTSFVFRETLTSHLLLFGNAYAQIIRNGLGEVMALYPLQPNKMDVWRHENGEIFYTYWREKDETKAHEKQGGVTLPKREVLHIPGLSFDGLVGYSPIALAKNAIGLAISTEEFGAQFFSNSANPCGIISHPDHISDHATLREEWEKEFRGNRRNGVAILEDGMKFTPISIAPDQAQFLETRKFQLSEIARIFRVPPHMIGDLERSTFSNIEHQSIDFAKYTLGPWLTRIEQELEKSLLSPAEQAQYEIRFNIEGLLRGDYETRMRGYAIGRQNGWLSANDIRALERQNPIPFDDGGDRYLVNGNMVDLKGRSDADTQD